MMEGSPVPVLPVPLGEGGEVCGGMVGRAPLHLHHHQPEQQEQQQVGHLVVVGLALLEPCRGRDSPI